MKKIVFIVSLCVCIIVAGAGCVNSEQPSVVIYHSPSKEAYNKENIDFISKNITEKLHKKNIHVIKLDIVEMTNDANLSKDKIMNMSRKKIADAVENNGDAHMFLDIQQELSFMPKDKTTAKVEGKNVARISFYVYKSKNFDQNLHFTRQLSETFQEMYPEVSKGILMNNEVKDEYHYKQDLHPHVVVINIGGPENTQKEIARTIEMLAVVINTIINRQ